MISVIDSYLVSLKVEKGLSSNTIYSYKHALTFFFSYVNKEYKDIKVDDIYEYISYLSDNDLTSRSINHKITSLKMFYKYLVKEGLVQSNIVQQVQRPKKEVKLPNYLTVEEVDLLLDVKLLTSFDYRNKAMFELLYATGMRVSELINVKVEDIDFYEDYILVTGKGNKQRLIPLTDVAILCLREYIDNHYSVLLKNKECEYLFISSRQTKITRQSFFKILKNQAMVKGLTKNIYPHIIRHSFATHLLNNGASLMVIKELLGHEDISTTGMYTHLSILDLKENYNLYHPHSN